MPDQYRHLLCVVLTVDHSCVLTSVMNDDLSPAQQAELVRALGDPALYGADSVQTLETHISYVLLTGRHAYKIKKAVNLGFLDFTTLSARRFYCEEELRLNRRFAPQIYLDVVAITGTPERPGIGGSGRVLDYAVRMREFPQEALLSRVLARGELTPTHVDELAAEVAAFHADAAVAPAGSPFGSPDDVRALAMENFEQIAPLLDSADDRAELDALRQWTVREHAARLARIRERQRDGSVRECHGDLHLGNIALVDGRVTIFDCIEFNERMRWGDLMADVAFLFMDLQDRKRADLAWRFLTAYLEATGDFAGMRLLRFYAAYRAMVRAKVARMRASQTTAVEARVGLIREYRDYVRLAAEYARTPRPAVIITHGLSGSGKTTWTQGLLEIAGAIRIRTDVERKRLHGLAGAARTASAVDSGIYAADDTARTYARLRDLAGDILDGGYSVIADGTFLKRSQRELFHGLAAERRAPFVILDCQAREETLRTRIAERTRAGTDASEASDAVLTRQLQRVEPLADDEKEWVVRIETDAPRGAERRPDTWRAVLERLRDPAVAP